MEVKMENIRGIGKCNIAKSAKKHSVWIIYNSTPFYITDCKHPIERHGTHEFCMKRIKVLFPMILVKKVLTNAHRTTPQGLRIFQSGNWGSGAAGVNRMLE
jgi:hypothetical protein